MATHPIKISLDHRKPFRHIISLDSHNLMIEVINPKKEPDLNLNLDIKSADIIFSATFNPFTENHFELYFRVLYPSNQKITGKPWTFDLFMDLASQYLSSVRELEPSGFALADAYASNMAPYQVHESEIVL